MSDSTYVTGPAGHCMKSGAPTGTILRRHRKMKYRCPVCKKAVRLLNSREPAQENFFPFCSRRCRLIDLGLWLDGRYTVSVEQEPPVTLEPADNGGAGFDTIH